MCVKGRGVYCWLVTLVVVMLVISDNDVLTPRHHVYVCTLFSLLRNVKTKSKKSA